MRIILWVVWCLLGFCLGLAGCRVGLRADMLDATAEMYQPREVRLPGFEAGYDPNS